MEIRDLRLFKAVYEERHFGRAGQRLNTVQSNVSARIKGLEKDLDVVLFRRNRHQVTATEAGEMLYGYAGRLIALEAEARSRVRHPGAVAGPLRLGSMETTAAVRLPEILAHFIEAHPLVDLSLDTAPTEDLVHRVMRRDLDLAFIGGMVHEDNLVQEPVFDERLALFTSPRMALEDVRDHAILVFRQGCAYRRHLESYLTERRLFAHRVIEMGTLDGILGCVASGMGLTMMPRSVVRRHRLANDLLEHDLPDRFARMVTHAVYRRDLSNGPALSAFVNGLPRAAA